MTQNFERHLAEDRRLVILRMLAHSMGYSANAYAVEAVLGDMGHVVSTDRVRSDIAWLVEQGLATTTQVGGVTIAKITERGLDTARGKTVVPGVKRPQPD
ncbi:hypothetical protein [Ottowia oryzae]|uniref:ArsR family transcriptional regulator n=1 Tax=Ottowia oryzae TaxID=2109914 RepID=A0A2S0MAY0_9BURK|nr:hypothetical protein [Ottowia oryzae]AVO33018.1 hypothetical protein C6570_01155 [Ottowia oryzae]